MTTVAVRFSDLEAATLDTARVSAGNLRRADFVRLAALTLALGEPKLHRPAPGLVETRRELGRIGGNLAQLLKSSNYGNLPEAVDIRAVLEDFAELGALLRARL